MLPAVPETFQSSPAPKSRCYPRSRRQRTVSGKNRFNPHRLRRAGATIPWPRRSAPPACFNPHRLRRAGATARTGGRMKIGRMFQSSPAPKSRCYARGFSAGRQAQGRFNPHRLRRAGATRAEDADEIAQTRVSILTGSEEPVLPRRTVWRRGVSRVSILTGSEEPVLRHRQCPSNERSRRFNPHRLRRAGATTYPCWCRGRPASFNPHRLRRAGATYGIKPLSRRALTVSILTGSEEPVLQSVCEAKEAGRRRTLAGVDQRQ